MLPKPGKTYTARVIETVLTLRDSPTYCFDIHSRLCVLQTAHVGADDLLSVPGFAETRWRFEGETCEWIPLFRYVGPAPITDFVDIAEDPDARGEYRATPIGFRREHTRRPPHQQISRQYPCLAAPPRQFQAHGRRSRPN